MTVRKRYVLAMAFAVASLAAVAWVAMNRDDRCLTMQEQLAVGHSADWVRLDMGVPEIATAVQRARASLPAFIKRVPRYDPSLEPASGVFVGDEIEKRDREDQRRAMARRDPLKGPRYAIRTNVLGMRIPDIGRVSPDIWLPHVRYDASEDAFKCVLPENAPSWFTNPSRNGRLRSAVKRRCRLDDRFRRQG